MASTSTNFTSKSHGPALDRERHRLLNLSTSISHSARELLLTSDLFAERIRKAAGDSIDIELVGRHLVQVRTNCTDAEYVAETVRTQLDHPQLTWRVVQACEESLGDAQVRLTLADFAYDRACEAA